MSWQSYIDDSLIGSGHIDKAAILSADGKATWASSPDFKVDPSEIPDILKAYAENSGVTSLVINGEKYFVISFGGSLRLKKGGEGMIVVMTEQTMIVAHHTEDVALTTASNTVEGLAEYLKKSGY